MAGLFCIWIHVAPTKVADKWKGKSVDLKDHEDCAESDRYECINIYAITFSANIKYTREKYF